MKTLYTSDGANFYEGDMQDGDREATTEELAARDAERAKRDAMPTYTERVDALRRRARSHMGPSWYRPSC